MTETCSRFEVFLVQFFIEVIRKREFGQGGEYER